MTSSMTCPKCKSVDCDYMDTIYDIEDTDGQDLISYQMLCNVCGCNFTDTFKHIRTEYIKKSNALK